MNIEVEDKELLIENDNGTVVIVPKEKSSWVRKKIEEGCFECVDNYISTLPVYDSKVKKAQSGVKIPLYGGQLNNVTVIGKRTNAPLNLSIESVPYLENLNGLKFGVTKESENRSLYTPTKSTNKDATYFDIDLSNLPDEIKNGDLEHILYLSQNRKPIKFNDGTEYITDFGIDENDRKYISFYRKDGNFLNDLFGSSKEYYNRYYIDDKYDKVLVNNLRADVLAAYLEWYEDKNRVNKYVGGYGKEKDFIPLTQGRYNTGRIPTKMIDEFYKVAKKEGVDIYDLLSVAGRESTFKGYNIPNDKVEKDNKMYVISGWDLANKYNPKSFVDYLADLKLPFIKTTKNFHGVFNEVTNEKVFHKYIKDNPTVALDYMAYVRKVPKPDYGEYDPYVELARMIKNDQMHKYNPGDPDYQNKLAKEKELLLKEKGIREYLDDKEKNFKGIKMEIIPTQLKEYGGRVKKFSLPEFDKFFEPVTAQSGKRIPAWNVTLPPWFDPRNWGVADYSDRKTRGEAYRDARKNGEKYFLYRGNKFNTKYDGTQEQQLKETGVTDERIHNRSTFEKRLTENIYPYSYEQMDERVWDAVVLNEKSDFRKLMDEDIDNYGDKNRLDALNLYSGIPQKYNSFKLSKYKPSIGSGKGTYYTFNEDGDDLFNILINESNYLNGYNFKPGLKEPVVDTDRMTMGTYTISTGEDDRGRYISFYDKWDIAPIDFGKPFEIYDRFYFRENPYYNNYLKAQEKYDMAWRRYEKENSPENKRKLDAARQEHLKSLYRKDKYIRQYYTDKELLNIDPAYRNFDVLSLQKELYNRGYDFPNSIKYDDKLDGVWGDETEAALKDYQEKNSENQQFTKEVKKPFKKKKTRRTKDPLEGIKLEMKQTQFKQYGGTVTHKLAAETPNGIDWFVFPTVDYKDGKWIGFKDNFEAYDYHKNNGTLMKLPNKNMALSYSENGLIKHNTPDTIEEGVFKGINQRNSKLPWVKRGLDPNGPTLTEEEYYNLINRKK